MTNDDDKVKVTFAPGCFDNFEGTQEELDALMAEIQNTFANMTPDEVEQHSRLISMDDNDAELVEIMRQLGSIDNRKLQ